MDVLTSTEFRKRYASLRAPTRVSVNGHVIGTWTPSLVPEGFTAEVEKALGLSQSLRVEVDETPILLRPEPRTVRRVSQAEAIYADAAGQVIHARPGGFNTRPFTPVPKPGRK